jgi:hypothetical protein
MTVHVLAGTYKGFTGTLTHTRDSGRLGVVRLANPSGKGASATVTIPMRDLAKAYPY